MQTCFTIRPARSDDAAAIAALTRLAFAAQPVALDPPPSALRESEASVAEQITAGGGAVAEANGAIVGSLLWTEREGTLNVARLAVDPAWRRQGIAQALLRAVEATARERRLIRVELGTRLALIGNRRLFAGCGFFETEQHAHPGYTAPTWVTMEKRLA
jgi:predicted N-acetyltransferase YhbS